MLTLAFIFVVGLLTQNFIGQKLVKWWEVVVAHIPVVGPIYTSVKQVSDTLLSSSGNAFRKALLIEYPRRGSYTIAFLTGIPGGDVVNHLKEDHVSVYVPTTPNPTSGFFLMVPRERSDRARHDRRRRAQVHRLDGRRGAVRAAGAGAPHDSRASAVMPARSVSQCSQRAVQPMQNERQTSCR